MCARRRTAVSWCRESGLIWEPGAPFAGKSRTAPATVSGERTPILPLCPRHGKAGRSKDPQVRRPASTITHPRRGARPRSGYSAAVTIGTVCGVQSLTGRLSCGPLACWGVNHAVLVTIHSAHRRRDAGMSAKPRTARDVLQALPGVLVNGSARSFTKLRILGGGGMDALAHHPAEEA